MSDIIHLNGYQTEFCCILISLYVFSMLLGRSHVFYLTNKLCVKVYIPVLQTAFVHQGVPVASHVHVLQSSP